MKNSLLISIAAAAAGASPVRQDTAIIQVRDTAFTANDYINGGCRDVILFFARGTSEPGNMGVIVGQQLADELISLYGENVAIQGINYPASVDGNNTPADCDPEGPIELQRLLDDAFGKCPDSKIAVSGYSQGGAVVHATFESLSSSVLDRVNAAVTFGGSRNKRDGGRIPNFPEEKTLIICNEGDGVCDGGGSIEAPHLQYRQRAPEAAQFIFEHVNKRPQEGDSCPLR